MSDEAPLTEAGLASRILERYREVYKASRDTEPWLRYGRRTVPVSTIAQQFYCEKAVQYSIEKPLRPSSEMLLGIAGHETAAASGAVLTAEEALTEAIAARERPVCLYEFRVGWQHRGVTILGFVDEAWFRGGNVDLVAERKFSGSTAFHKPYHVQASLYCLGLREMGFSVEQTRYRIAIHRRECHDCALLTAGGCPGAAPESEGFSCERGSCVGQSFRFDATGATEDLNHALEFWTGEREAEPTTQASRCRFCRYRQICDARRA